MSLSPFQILALGLLSVLLLLTVIGGWRHWIGRAGAVVWSMVWLAAGLAVLWPDATTSVAKAVGIRRGADLLLYCGLGVMMVGFLMTYVRLRRLRREVTLLTRSMAIRDARVDDGAESASGSVGDTTVP